MGLGRKSRFRVGFRYQNSLVFSLGFRFSGTRTHHYISHYTYDIYLQFDIMIYYLNGVHLLTYNTELDFPISRYCRNSENDSMNMKVNDSVAIVYDITMFRGRYPI